MLVKIADVIVDTEVRVEKESASLYSGLYRHVYRFQASKQASPC